jgi:hypothetical protein
MRFSTGKYFNQMLDKIENEFSCVRTTVRREEKITMGDGTGAPDMSTKLGPPAIYCKIGPDPPYCSAGFL